MPVALEPPTPFDQSLLWSLHHAYFQARGIAAWTSHEVPWASTSNFGRALQHARHLVATAPPGDGPVHVLEVGSGLGRFAANVLRALDTATGPEGRALLGRIRWFLTDFAARTLREAAATPELREHVAAGRVIPAPYDLRTPDLFWTPSLPPIDRVVANYVACVVASRNLQFRDEDGWFEQRVALGADLDRAALFADPTRPAKLDVAVSWAPVALPPEEAAVLDPFVASLPAYEGRILASLGWPAGFLRFLRAVGPRLSPAGRVVVDDYGAVSWRGIVGLRDRRPQQYGNSLAAGVAFPLFPAWAAASGWTARVTTDPFDNVHTAELRPGAAEDGAAAFERCFVEEKTGEDFVDLMVAARVSAERQEWDRAVRFYTRALRIDPENSEAMHALGSAALEAGQPEVARPWLEKGLHLHGHREPLLDFEFQLGRAALLLGDLPGAVEWYERSLKKEDHPTTWTNLGLVYETVGRAEQALRCYRMALAAGPAPRARERLEVMRDALWLQRIREIEGPDATDPLAG